jgi:hypothetical protein
MSNTEDTPKPNAESQDALTEPQLAEVSSGLNPQPLPPAPPPEFLRF